MTNGRMTEVKNGLEGGEFVVLDPTAILSEQQKQKIQLSAVAARK